MNKSQKRGFGFGITSGIITTLGILVGLYSALSSKIIVLVGILSVGIADAFSDALGIHLSEESSGKSSHKLIWQSTIFTFFSKLFFAGIFIIPILIFEMKTAIIVGVSMGVAILSVFSYKTAIDRGENGFKKIFEHVSIAVLVILITYFVGRFISI